MQYNPKLKNAMAEIKAILDKYDIAAAVVLHAPGHAEFHTKIDPSYSGAKWALNPDGSVAGVRLRIKASEVGKKKAMEVGAATANMFQILGEQVGKLALVLMETCDAVNQTLSAEHGHGRTTGEQEQNN